MADLIEIESDPEICYSISSGEEPEAQEKEQEPEPEPEPKPKQEQEQELKQEEGKLVLLIKHRSSEVQHFQERITHYNLQLEEAEKRLHDSKALLASFRNRRKTFSSTTPQSNVTKCVTVKPEPGSLTPIHANQGSKSKAKSFLDSNVENRSSFSNRSNLATTAEQSKSLGISFKEEVVENPNDGRKKKLGKSILLTEQKYHKELVPLIRSSSSPSIPYCDTSSYYSSQHKRKLRNVALCPVNDQLFVTSALDGMINLWQVESKGSCASLLCTADCMTPKHRRWPEDIAWHPDGNRVFSVYSADGGESQISILRFNETNERADAIFLDDKPHFKGIINCISFLPWESAPFVTGGCDHAVILWNMKDEDNMWNSEALHINLHSSAVMGVSSMQLKQIVLSVGADKRIVGFDVQAENVNFKHLMESKCMNVLPNPCDFNMFMVQIGSPEKQLRLFDIRLKEKEVHAFGWKQESSESQSALISQAWSPDGLYLTSGSADPVIHVFDIRYNSHKPSQSIKAHQNRVFKAVWLQSSPLLISISSDLHIGLHKMI